MNYLENFIRPAAYMIGWEITGAIEIVIWTVGIAVFLFFCFLFSCLAVKFQVLRARAF